MAEQPTMYDRIMVRCHELGKTPGEVCDSISLRRAFISELKHGRTKSLSAENVSRLAAALRCSCDYLINGVDFRDELSPVERSLVSVWRQCSDEERENVAFMLRNYGFRYEPPASKQEAAREIS